MRVVGLVIGRELRSWGYLKSLHNRELRSFCFFGWGDGPHCEKPSEVSVQIVLGELGGG